MVVQKLNKAGELTSTPDFDWRRFRKLLPAHLQLSWLPKEKLI